MGGGDEDAHWSLAGTAAWGIGEGCVDLELQMGRPVGSVVVPKLAIDSLFAWLIWPAENTARWFF